MKAAVLALVCACTPTLRVGVELGEFETGLPPDTSSSGNAGLLHDAPVYIETDCSDVDVLFVVDNSGSMNDNQIAVADFSVAITSALTQANLHIAVTTTDHNNSCGALGGLIAPGYLTDADNLAGMLPGMLQVGVNGSGAEQQFGAVIASLDPWIARPGGCNEGFRRPGAAFIPIVVTDEDDVVFPGEPAEWAARLDWTLQGADAFFVLVSTVREDVKPPFNEGNLYALAGLLPSHTMTFAEAADPSAIAQAVDAAVGFCDFSPEG